MTQSSISREQDCLQRIGTGYGITGHFYQGTPTELLGRLWGTNFRRGPKCFCCLPPLFVEQWALGPPASRVEGPAGPGGVRGHRRGRRGSGGRGAAGAADRVRMGRDQGLVKEITTQPEHPALALGKGWRGGDKQQQGSQLTRVPGRHTPRGLTAGESRGGNRLYR